jgi:hypothetical protein
MSGSDQQPLHEPQVEDESEPLSIILVACLVSAL